MDAKKSRIRHIVKSITWRALASITTFGLTYWITGDIEKATVIMGFEVVLKMLLYYLHERAWYNYIRLGRDNE